MELPVSFADYTRTLLGDEDYKELVTSLESEQSVSIRLNPLKPFAFRSGEHAVPWCTSGFYLEERPTFTFDPLFHAGCYYVQEASSMVFYFLPLENTVSFSFVYLQFSFQFIR